MKMAEIEFKNPSFIKTAIHPKDYPTLRDDNGRLLPEIAVAGRSNVGKSSLLNHLFNRKGLVKTSSQPGKTQAINFFILNKQVTFVDLPGYGYAKVPLSVRKHWGPMVQAYFEKRETLKLVLFLFDIRRLPSDDDYKLLEWAIYNDLALILVLTKTDKVKRNEKAANTAKILKALDVENLHFVHYSSTKNEGRDQLISMIRDALNDEESN
jgi:GTP-binding protein